MPRVNLTLPKQIKLTDDNGYITDTWANLLNLAFSILVQGPSVSVDNATVKFDGTSGKLIK